MAWLNKCPACKNLAEVKSSFFLSLCKSRKFLEEKNIFFHRHQKENYLQNKLKKYLVHIWIA